MSRTAFFLTTAGLVVAALAGCGEAPRGPAPPAVPAVKVSELVEETVTDYQEFTGRTDAVESVEVRARVNGYLDKIEFKEGDEVKKDALLFQIDPRPYKAELDRTQGQIALQEANLKRREADLRRNEPLGVRGVVSAQEMDQFRAARDEAAAAVTASKANSESSRLNLEFTDVKARIGGRIGRPLVTVGNLITADQTLLTTIVSVDPMYAYFDVDERTMLRVQKLIREGKVQSARESEYPVELGLANEDGNYPHKGTIDFVNNRVDASTGTLQVRGVFKNPPLNPKVPSSRLLTPGLFVGVRLPIGVPHKALLVSDRAVAADLGQKFLYVVDAADVVRKRLVTTGQMHRGLRAVEGELKAGDRVVVSGLQRVRDGAEVKPELVPMPSAVAAKAPGSR